MPRWVDTRGEKGPWPEIAAATIAAWRLGTPSAGTMAAARCGRGTRYAACSHVPRAGGVQAGPPPARMYTDEAVGLRTHSPRAASMSS